MVPEIGRESAIENAEEIREYLDGADIVFIAAGLGGGTGTGASPVIAQIAREAGALTISVVTKPFMFEGGKRDKLARAGLEELKKESDSIVVIPNDKLLSIVDKGLGLKESFKIVDEVLARAVTGTSGIILSSGDQDINLDFADLRTVMSYRGLALMGMGQAEGEKSAYEAIKNAIESPLLDDVSINGAMGILVHFNIHPNYPLIELTSAMEVVKESADGDATIIMGTTTDDTLPADFVKITLIATGFEKPEEEKKIVRKESDGTNLNIMQKRIQKPNNETPPKPAPKQPQSQERDEYQPQESQQQQQNQQSYQKPASNQSQQHDFDLPPQQSSFGGGNQSSFGGGFNQQSNRPQNFGGGSQSSFGGGFNQQHNRSQNFGSNQGGFKENKRPGYTRVTDKNQQFNDEYLDVPTWLRQRGSK
jgi:cell division protein FtsZ